MGKDSDDGSTLGFGSCQPFKELWKKLDRWQYQMFSMMARMKRKWSADESWLDLKKRKVRMGRYLVQKHSILLSDRLLSKVFSWAGHVARMSLDKWTLRCTLWNGCCWKQDGKHNPAWNNYDVQHRYAFTGISNRKEPFLEHIIFYFFDKTNRIWWVEA